MFSRPHPAPEDTPSDPSTGAIPKSRPTQPLQQHLIAAVHENASNENAENSNMESSNTAPTSYTPPSTENATVGRDTATTSQSDSSPLPMDVGTSSTKRTMSEPCEPMDVTEAEVKKTERPRDSVDELNSIPGVQVFRPGDFDALQLPPEQEQVGYVSLFARIL